MPESNVPTAVLVSGFEAARARFEQAHHASDESFHGLFETVAWAGSLRDRLKDASDPVLRGFWYVRNVVVHRGADVLNWVYIPGAEPGLMVPGVSALGTVTQEGWWWRPYEEVPPPGSGSGADEYRDHLAGHEVRATLDAVLRSLPRDA